MPPTKSAVGTDAGGKGGAAVSAPPGEDEGPCDEPPEVPVGSPVEAERLIWADTTDISLCSPGRTVTETHEPECYDGASFWRPPLGEPVDALADALLEELPAQT